jgi:hypothetical protein
MTEMSDTKPIPTLTEPGAANHRSPKSQRLPYGTAPLTLTLADAVALIAKAGAEGSLLPAARLAIIAGNTVSSSSFVRKIGALRAFGLISEQEKDLYALTDLGISLSSPKSAEAFAAARKQAFLNVDAFNTLFQQQKGKLLAADEFLRNILEQDCKIPKEHSGQWAVHFRDAARAAGLFYDRGDGRTQVAESPIIPPAAPQSKEINGTPAVAELKAEPAGDRIVLRDQVCVAMGHTTRIELGGGKRAEFSVPDGITRKDAQKLKKALEGLAVIIDSMVIEEDP